MLSGLFVLGLQWLHWLFSTIPRDGNECYVWSVILLMVQHFCAVKAFRQYLQLIRKKSHLRPYTNETEDLMKALFRTLSEKDRRRYAAVEAQKLGWGGIDYITELLGIDSRTISQGLLDLKELEDQAGKRVRRTG